MGSDCGGFGDRSFLLRDAGRRAPGHDAAASSESHSLAPPDDAAMPWRNDAWDVGPVEPRAGFAPQLVIDASGVLNVVYVASPNDLVIHAQGTPGHFSLAVVGMQRSRSAPSLAISRAGTLRLAYAHEVAPAGAVFAQQNPDGGWFRSSLPFDDGPPGVAQPCVVAPWIGADVYVGVGPPRASGARDVLVTQGIPMMSLGMAASSASIAIHGAATTDHSVHVLVDDGLGALQLATRVGTPTGYSAWWTTRAIAGGSAGSLASGPGATLHLVYARPRGTLFELVHVVGPGDGTSPVEEVVLSGAARIAHTSIAVTPLGAVHIAIESGGILRHATNATGGWSVEDVDRLAAGAGPSIAVDAERPFIAYVAFEGPVVVATPG